MRSLRQLLARAEEIEAEMRRLVDFTEVFSAMRKAADDGDEAAIQEGRQRQRERMAQVQELGHEWLAIWQKIAGMPREH